METRIDSRSQLSLLLKVVYPFVLGDIPQEDGYLPLDRKILPCAQEMKHMEKK